LRLENSRYAKECKKSDELSDLVIALSEKQYESKEIYKKIKKFVSNENQDALKNSAMFFNKVKNTIEYTRHKKYFSLVIEWIELQKEMMEIDEKINEVNL
jgi:hypothetical protein